jgi:hypothetical protein
MIIGMLNMVFLPRLSPVAPILIVLLFPAECAAVQVIWALLRDFRRALGEA